MPDSAQDALAWAQVAGRAAGWAPFVARVKGGVQGAYPGIRGAITGAGWSKSRAREKLQK